MLKQLDDDLKNPNLNLSQLNSVLEQCAHDLIANKIDSTLALVHRYQHLEQSLNSYYQRNFYSQKTWWQKAFFWFLPTNPDETLFLSSMKKIKLIRQSYEQSYNINWHISPIFEWFSSLFQNKATHKTHHPGYPDGNKLAVNIRILSHRLMGSKDYTKIKHLHGLRRDLAAYKFKRELEKFMARYELTPNQQQKLQLLVGQMNSFLLLNTLINKHRAINEKYKNTTQEQARINDLIWTVYESLESIPIGQSVVIPHGFKFEGGFGHSTLVEFRKTSTDGYSVHFINTGTGALDQLGKFKTQELTTDASEKKSLNYGYVKHLSFEKIVNDQLIKNVFKPLIQNYASKEQVCAAMNKPILSYYKQGLLKQGTIPIEYQTNGTCTHSCWRAWLSLNSDKALFQTFELFVTNKALKKIATLGPQTEAKSEERNALNLLQEDGKKLHAHINTVVTKELKNIKNNKQHCEFFQDKKPQRTEYECLAEIQKQLSPCP
jgi:hypothetical protein